MMENAPDPHSVRYDDLNPETHVRTDLWGTMQLPQLINQRELLMGRLSTLQKIIGPAVSPTVLNMYNAMQMGLSDINGLIDNRSNTKKK